MHAYNIKLLREDICTTKRNLEVLFDGGKDAGLEIKAENLRKKNVLSFVKPWEKSKLFFLNEANQSFANVTESKV